MLLVSYECSRSFAPRAGAFAAALSTSWAAPGLTVARRAAALAGGLTGCVAGAVALAAFPAATRGIRPATLAAFPAATAATAAGKLSHRLAACLATTTLISRLSTHVSRLHQAFLIEPDQIQTTGLRKRLHH